MRRDAHPLNYFEDMGLSQQVLSLVASAPHGYDFAEVAHVHARMCARQEKGDHWLEGYRKAGLPV